MRRRRDDALACLCRDLIERRLPDAARNNTGWPVSLDHCFARVLLDNACGGVWRDSVAPPAWAFMPDDRLRHALDLGEGVLTGKTDLDVLNRHSLAWRGKGGAAATRSADLDGPRRAVCRRSRPRLGDRPSLFDWDLDEQR